MDEELTEIFEGGSEEENEAASAVAAMVTAGDADSLSNEFFVEEPKTHRGRVPGSRTVLRRPCSWYEDYLADTPRYRAYKFREVFRVPVKLYHVLHNRLIIDHPSLNQRIDGLGRPGHTSHQKCLAGFRRLGQPTSYRKRDDSSCMSPESQRIYFRTFVIGVEKSYGPRYLNREPNMEELRRITSEYEEEGFPGCRGSLDCMHVRWKQCPLEVRGQYQNSKNGKLATISCEAIVAHGLYCWHWFAGRAGTNNDLTVLQNSPYFNALLLGQRALKLPEGYYVNGVLRNWVLYFLTDGIYGDWALFQKPITSPVDEKEEYLTERQESTRKDVERFNGCLQGRFKILRHESFEFDPEFIVSISNCCVIIHNILADSAARSLGSVGSWRMSTMQTGTE